LAPHPVLQCAANVEGALKDVADVDPGFMATDEKREALVRLGKLGDQLEALRLRVIANAGDVAEVDGMPNVASWTAPRTLTDPATNHRAEALARSLDTRWTVLGTALAEGSVNLAQAKVITDSLDVLAAADIDPGLLTQAEAHLVELAGTYAPRQLRILGRKILSVIAPDTFDDEERKRLEKEEQRAHARARLSMRRRGDGTVSLQATLSEVAAARLRSVLDAFTSPRHNHAAKSTDNATGDQTGSSAGWGGPCPLTDPATGQKVPHDQRLGLAFGSLLESLDPTLLPNKAGAGTTLVITMDLADLLNGVGAGTLPDGSRISAGQVRRLACNAGLVPAVLGGKSEVLDLGRAERFFSGKQKQAMGIRHRTCRAEGCQVPAEWCEAHHDNPWSKGGRTDLEDGILLCPFHHHRVHDDRHLVQRLPNGDLRYRRRT
jgi:hypothetical protein